MKKRLALVLALMLVLSMSVAVLAETSNGIYVHIDDINDFYVTESDFNFTEIVSGYVAFETVDMANPSPPPDQTRRRPLLKTLDFYVNDVRVDRENFSNVESQDIRVDKKGREFAFDWEISNFGTYNLRVEAELITGWSNSADAELHEVITVVVHEETVSVEFPAAPAIAARLFEANDINPRYGSGKSGGNYISDVARLMDRTYFMDEPKSNLVDDEKVMNKAYWDAVWNYLEGRGLSLPNKPEGYIW